MKVPAPEQPVQDFQEPIGDNEIPLPEPQGDKNNDSPFKDQKFDDGISETDPHKHIEQLAGKLSQLLRKYNEEGPVDEELNKYVVNFIISASVPNLTPENAKDVVKKVEDNIGKETSQEEPSMEQDTTMDQPQEPEQEMPKPPAMEGKKNKKKTIKESENLDELIEALYSDECNNTIAEPKTKKKNIFKSPEFK